MRNLIRLSVVFILACVLSGCISIRGGVVTINTNQGVTSVSTKTPPIRHVVLFKFKDDTTPKQQKVVENAFRKLPSQIKEVRDFEWGTNVSPENINQGFTHCFVLTFDDAKGRDVYLDHEAHTEFKKILGPHLDKALVVDYQQKK